MMKFVVFFLWICSIVSFGQDINLVPVNWKFKRDIPTGSHTPNPEFAAEVPGVVHLDLMRNYLLYDDFYNGNNENKSSTKFIETQNWVYSSVLKVDSAILYKSNLEMVFEGLDTYAQVYLNDSLILESDNMFVCYKVPVKGIIKAGDNRLRIHFTSPLNKHESDVMNARYELPSGNENTDLKVSAYTRKAAYHFGWDWGPRFVTCGIWKPCYLRAWDNFRISDFFAETISISGPNASMLFQFTLESDSTYTEPHRIEMMGMEFEIYIQKGKQTVKFYHHVDNAKLWYPNGYGEQPIYSSNLYLLNKDFKKVYATVVNFAVRKVELVNEKDSIGTSFYFKVNGKPIFAKGANYIPQDMFLPRVTNEQTHKLLELVELSGMNMLRIWGGGIYESDYFYQQCDLRGIMVWQDFMFANSMYPATKEFHESVSAEIEDNVKKLRNHPCLVLWCGNNEIEVAWQNWGWQKQYGYSASDSTEIWNNYKTLFHELIPSKLKELDPSRSYLPSSPQSNWGKPENFNHGAMHYWGVWHGKEPIENFKSNVGRFMVEYGFQSYPIYDYLSKTLAPDQIHRDSSAFQNRQKSYIGDRLMDAEIQKYFGNLDIMDWLWATQFVQAQALKTAIIAHRLKAPHCMGTLFWQLNDCWPGASWSVLDYYQNEKLAYKEIQKWFSPVIAVFEEENDYYSVKLHSDQNFSGVLVISAYHEETGEMIKTDAVAFTINALETKQAWIFPIKKFKKKIDLSKLRFEISVKTNEGQDIFNDQFLMRKLRIDEIY